MHIKQNTENKYGTIFYAAAAFACLLLVGFAGFSGMQHIDEHSRTRWQSTLDSVFLLENLRTHISDLYVWQEQLMRSDDPEYRFLAARKTETTRILLQQSMERCADLIATHISEDEYKASRNLLRYYINEQIRIEASTQTHQTRKDIEDELLNLRSMQEVLLGLTYSLRESLITNIREADRRSFENLIKTMLIGMIALFVLLVLITISIIKQLKTENLLHDFNKTLEQKVRDSTSELQASNRELDAFVSSVAYDIRAPLRRIKQYGDAFLEDFRQDLTDESTVYINRISRLTNEALVMIENLLALSRITAAEVNRSETDLTAIAKDIIRDLEVFYKKHRPMVIIPKGLRAHADNALVRILLFNLLDNAFKFTTNTVEPLVELGVTADSEPPVYFVRDNGAGYEPRYAGKLFLAFERLHASTEYPGHGMGLVTAARIINKHGGTIRAESSPGKGATFFFTLSD